MFTEDQLEYLSRLPEPDPSWGGLGGGPLPFDPRDYSILSDPAVARIMQIGPPRAVDLSNFAGGVYDQGAEGACVAFSEAGAVSLEQAIANRPWPWLDAENLYRRNGGHGDNGIDTSTSLEDILQHGINRQPANFEYVRFN